jgi:hypothetical protein
MWGIDLLVSRRYWPAGESGGQALGVFWLTGGGLLVWGLSLSSASSISVRQQAGTRHDIGHRPFDVTEDQFVIPLQIRSNPLPLLLIILGRLARSYG